MPLSLATQGKLLDQVADILENCADEGEKEDPDLMQMMMGTLAGLSAVCMILSSDLADKVQADTKESDE